jgi:hypothetical protein
LRHDIVSKAGIDGLAVKVGKDPYQFDFYCWLADALLKNFSVSEKILFNLAYDGVLAHFMLVFGWNLMSRISNTIAVSLSELSWDCDSLSVLFGHTKTDPDGQSHCLEPRHIFANPLMPEICPILGMAIFFACFPVTTQEKHVFPGSSQDERYRKILDRFFDTKVGKDELRRCGIDSNDLGTHSTRKGASSYVVSGSTACPSFISIMLRAGWTLGAVLAWYLHYNEAGDKYTGRSVTGLPMNKSLFAILPPFFPSSDPVINWHFQICH